MFHDRVKAAALTKRNSPTSADTGGAREGRATHLKNIADPVFLVVFVAAVALDIALAWVGAR